MILGGFADAHLADLDEAGLDAFERLLNVPDNDVYDWVTGACAAPADYETDTLQRLRAFRFELTQNG